MKKPSATSSGSGMEPGGAVTDANVRAKYPALLEYLTTTKWEDGSPRETSTLTIFVEGGQFKVAVNDRALKRSVYVTARTLQDALAAAQEAVAGDAADWRAWNAGKRK